jgi:hypothetical protein
MATSNQKTGCPAGRLLSFSPLKPEQWDRYKHLRGAMIIAMTICSVAAPIDWYNWARGTVSLVFPVSLTAGVLAILVAAPRKFELITLSVGLTFLLSILGTLLRRAPLGVGLAIAFATGFLYFGCVYIGERLKRCRGK